MFRSFSVGMRLAALLGVSTLALLASCGNKQGGDEDVAPLVTVQTTTVQRAPIEQDITAEAVLSPVDQASVPAKISAPVVQFYVNRGSHVKKGELLARLENRDLQGALAQAQANYDTTTKATVPEDLKKAQLEVTQAKQELDAQQKLFDSRQQLFNQGALAGKDLNAARVSLTQAQNTYTIAQQHLESLQSVGASQTQKAAAGQLQTAEANMSYTEIRAPISGVVTDRPLFAGEMAQAGQPLLTIMDTSSVKAIAHIPQEQAALLKVGDAAQITPLGSDRHFPARITVVSPATDPNSTTVEVWAVAANPKSQLRPGTTVQLAVTAKKIPDALIVPAAAVVNTDSGPAVVTVVTDNKNPKEPVERAKQQPVKLGVHSGDNVQVVSGVQAGQTIIASGAYGIPDGTQVKRESEAGAADKGDAADKSDSSDEQSGDSKAAKAK